MYGAKSARFYFTNERIGNHKPEKNPAGQRLCGTSLIPPTGSGWIVQVQPTRRRRLDRFFEYHPRQWVDCSSPAYERSRADRVSESHPRQWVDRSRPAYERSRADRVSESHPRQWVDRSSPAYERSRADRVSESHPRQWVDRSSPAYEQSRADRVSESHPRQWVDRSSPAYERSRADRVSESHPRQWVDRSSPAYKEVRPAVLCYLSPVATRGERRKRKGDSRCAPMQARLEQSTHSRGWDLRKRASGLRL
jgi:hypothetical protein